MRQDLRIELKTLKAHNKDLEERLSLQDLRWDALTSALQTTPDVQWLRHGLGHQIAKALQRRS